jgi:hypothetical protein
MLTTHPLLVPRLRKSRSYTSCHPNAPLWSVTGPLCLFIWQACEMQEFWTCICGRQTGDGRHIPVLCLVWSEVCCCTVQRDASMLEVFGKYQVLLPEPWRRCWSGFSLEGLTTQYIQLHWSPAVWTGTWITMDDMDNRLQKFWTLWKVPDRELLTSEEKDYENFLRVHIIGTRLAGTWCSLPLLEATPELGCSRKNAVQRLKKHMETCLKRSPERREQFVAFMREYRDLGRTELAPEEEFQKSHGSWYLPNHAVTMDSSSTTKLHVVFEANSKRTSVVWRNDKVMVGVRLQDCHPTATHVSEVCVTPDSGCCCDVPPAQGASEGHFQRILRRGVSEANRS